VALEVQLAAHYEQAAFVEEGLDVKSVEPKGGSPVLLKAAEDAVAKWKFASGGESREVIEVRFAP
jgi:hypothetical protein